MAACGLGMLLIYLFRVPSEQKDELRKEADPNGLCYYKGRWHVFYQLHPYGTQWGLCHWGHVSSEDMVTWRREPIAFAPSLEQEKDGEFKPETEFRPWDCGHNFYAPQSFNTNGRQIMYGWMSPFVEPIPMQDDGWCGQLTLPREIMLGDDGDLVCAPVEEIRKLREDAVEYGPLTLDADGDIAYDDQIGRVVIDRQAMVHGDRGYCTAPISADDLSYGLLRLRVFVDRGSVEVHVNGGKQVMSSCSYASKGPRAIRLVAESGSLTVTSLTLHHLKSIGLD